MCIPEGPVFPSNLGLQIIVKPHKPGYPSLLFLLNGVEVSVIRTS